MFLTIFPFPSIQQPSDSSEGAVIRYYDVNYIVTFNITFINGGSSPISGLEIWVSVIGNRTGGGRYDTPVQNSYIISITPPPVATLRDVNNLDNEILYFNTSIPANSTYMISMIYNISSFEKAWLINPSLIENYNTTSEIYLNYTKPENLIESDNPLIISFAHQLAGDLENPLLVVQKFYEWVSSNIQYQVQTVERGALWALENMVGDCSEYSDLFIALCRAYGIPARKVLGWAFSDPVNYMALGSYQYHNYSAHAWVEVYFEEYGWIAFDPTWGNSGYYYSGRMDPFHLVTIVGQNVSTTDFEAIEFSFIGYRVSGTGDLSYSTEISLDIIKISSITASYSVEFASLVIVVLTVILLVAGVVSKRTFKKSLSSVK
ncbi:MAG: transglutaminase-like domain-containing protein [Candidatus Odinarchaeota archaeon]